MWMKYWFTRLKQTFLFGINLILAMKFVNLVYKTRLENTSEITLEIDKPLTIFSLQV